MTTIPYNLSKDRKDVYRKSGAVFLLELGQLYYDLNTLDNPFSSVKPDIKPHNIAADILKKEREVLAHFAHHPRATLRKYICSTNIKGKKEVNLLICKLTSLLAYHILVCANSYVPVLHLAKSVLLDPSDIAEILETRRVIACLIVESRIHVAEESHTAFPSVYLDRSILNEFMGSDKCIPQLDKQLIEKLRARKHPYGHLGKREARSNRSSKSNDVKEFVSGIPELTPQAMYDALEKHGYIGQEKARKALCLSAHRHVSKLKKVVLHGVDPDTLPPSQHALIKGGTGVGKSMLASLLFGKILKLPYCVISCPDFSETGYVGRSVSDIPLELIENAGGREQIGQLGIVIFNEIDKLGDLESRHISRYGVQRSLLMFLEPSVISPSASPFDRHRKPIRFSTRSLLCIGVGTFEALDIAKDRESIGFGSEQVKSSQSLTTQDFERLGFMRELIGRFQGGLIELDELNKHDLVNILRHNVIAQWQKDLELDNIALEIDHDVLNLIASNAIVQRAGARGIQGCLSDAIRSACFSAYSSEGKDRTIYLFADGDNIGWKTSNVVGVMSASPVRKSQKAEQIAIEQPAFA